MRIKKHSRDFQTIPNWLDAELRNWSRYCWQGKWPHPLPLRQCASLEGNYIHERFPDERVESEFKPIPIHEEHAKIVQSVWDGLPHIPKQVLSAEYPRRHESGREEHGRVAAARWLRRRLDIYINVDDYEAYLSSASYKVMQAFEVKT